MQAMWNLRNIEGKEASKQKWYGSWRTKYQQSQVIIDREKDEIWKKLEIVKRKGKEGVQGSQENSVVLKILEKKKVQWKLDDPYIQ